MKCPKTYGKDHTYYHDKLENLAGFSHVHLEDANQASEYLTKMKHRPHHQGSHLDMDRNIQKDHLGAFTQVIGMHPGIEDLRLSRYENLHLDKATFFAFCDSIHNLGKLKILDVNLRWCQQVHDEWLEKLGQSISHNHLEEFELWLWNCKRISDDGIKHLLEGLKNCTRLKTFKLYQESKSTEASLSAATRTRCSL